jgi:hypothetical protein
MKKGVTLTIRRVLEVKDEADHEGKVDDLVGELEAAGWVVDEGERDDPNFDEYDSDDDFEDDEDP